MRVERDARTITLLHCNSRAACVDSKPPRCFRLYTEGVTDKHPYLLYIAVFGGAILLGTVLFLLLPSSSLPPQSGSPASIEEALEEAAVETPSVAPDANPLRQVTPAANPIEKTNPFKNEYKNPFR